MSAEINKTYWDCNTSQYDTSSKVDEFLKELVELYKKHNLSISHEDKHGNFIIEEYAEENVKWIEDPYVKISEGP